MTEYIIFDIETVPREVPKAISDERLRKLKEDFVSEEVINNKYIKWKTETWKYQPGGSRPIAIGIHDTYDGKYQCWVGDDEAELATNFLDYLRNIAPLHKLVGFNIKKFDLPQLIVSIGKIGYEPLGIKYGRYDIIDLMKEPYGYDTGMFSLDYYANIFGLPTSDIDGSMVSDIWEQDKKDNGTRVKDYCLADVKLTKRIFDIYRLFHKF